MPTEPKETTKQQDSVEVEAPEAAQETEEKRPTPQKRRRGFAAMDRTKVREIASKGGVAAHSKGTAHRFTQDEARTAGRKGGLAPHRARGRKVDSNVPA